MSYHHRKSSTKFKIRKNAEEKCNFEHFYNLFYFSNSSKLKLHNEIADSAAVIIVVTEKHEIMQSKHQNFNLVEPKTPSYTTFTENFKDFLLNTSLHGLKYAANANLSKFERAFFVLAFIFVVVLSGNFISNVYDKWSATPIIISTNPTPTYTSNIPFPAITICSLNKVKKSRAIDIKEGSLNYTLLWSLCAKDVNFSNSMSNLFGTWKFFRTILLEVSQTCNDMFLYCQFGAKIEDCKTLFKSVLTDDGLCCTFNAVDSRFMFKNYTEGDILDSDQNEDYIPVDWNPEKGYEDNLPKHFSPRIARGVGKEMGMTVILNASTLEYFCASSRGSGYKVLVHNPNEQPKISNFGFFIHTGKETRVSITPTYADATPRIRSIDKRIRHCLFSDEANLTYFRSYSRKNCELECEANILVAVCGCVLYYLPRVQPDVRICGPKDNNCTRHTQKAIISANTNLTCEICYPACFELSFTPSISFVQILGGNFSSRDDYPESFFTGNISDLSIIHFYYESNFFRGMTKDEIIGFTEFLSNTGGLLGLFMGFSMFSMIEILYFMSLKPFCLYKKQHKQKKVNKLIFDVAATPWQTTKNLKNIQKDNSNSEYPRKNIMKKILNKYSSSSPSATAAAAAQVFPYYE